LEKLDFTVENYKKKVAVSKVHLEYKEKMNYSLTEFFKISGKHNNNIDFIKQSLKIFEQNKEEFQDSYTSFLDITDVKVSNY